MQVVDEKEEPIAGALVQLVDGSFIGGDTLTDSRGRARLDPGWLFPPYMLLVTTPDGWKWWVDGIPPVVFLGGPKNNAGAPISPERQRNPFLPATEDRVRR